MPKGRYRKSLTELQAQKRLKKDMIESLEVKEETVSDFSNALGISLPEGHAMFKRGIPASSRHLLPACAYLKLNPLDYYNIPPMRLMRLRTGINLITVAKKIGISSFTLKSIESQGKGYINPSQVIALSQLYHSTPAEVMQAIKDTQEQSHGI